MTVGYYRFRGKYFEMDGESPRAEIVCGRCGFRYNVGQLMEQYDYQGSSQLQGTNIFVCTRCYDEPQPQTSPYVLRPDPDPAYNARPEPYVVDETNWLTTEGGDIIDTQEDEHIISSPPESEE